MSEANTTVDSVFNSTLETVAMTNMTVHSNKNGATKRSKSMLVPQQAEDEGAG